MNNRQLSAVFKENAGRIFRFLRLRTLSKEVAEDLTSETFLRFVRKRDIWEASEPVSIRSYLYGIAKLVLLEYLRRKYRQEISLDIEAPEFCNYVEQYVVEYSDTEKRIALLITLIDKLPMKQREVARLRLLEKRNSREIMAILKKDSNYVRTTQKRAIASLRKLWETECTQPDTGILELTQDE